MATKKKLTKADNGLIVKNNKIISKSTISGTRDDGSGFRSKSKVVWDNAGTKDNPVATNQRSRRKTTNIDEDGKTTTTVTKTNSAGETKTRKAIFPVVKKGTSYAKKGGIIRSKKK